MVDPLTIGATVLSAAGDIASTFGGEPKRAGAFSKDDLRYYLEQLYRLAGIGFSPGTKPLYDPKTKKFTPATSGGLFLEEGGPNLGIFGLGPEQRALKMAEIEKGAQPEFARSRALVSRATGGAQPGLLADLGTSQGANLLDVFRQLQIFETEKQGQIMQDLFRQISQLIQA